jgi:chromosome segregation ATPase
MKNFQQNLFIVLALGLCGLCAWQWYGQTVQRATIQVLDQMVYDRNASIQSDTNSMATLNARVNDLDTRIAGLKATVATNVQVMASQKAQITLLQFNHENDTNEIAQYKVAVATLESKLKDAYAGIDQQNVAITNLLSERNDLVQRYDELATNRNDIVLKYNALVKQMQSSSSANNNQ